MNKNGEDLTVLQIGRYFRYKDPKDSTVRTDLLINFDLDTAIFWNTDLKCPYAVLRIQVLPLTNKLKEGFWK